MNYIKQAWLHITKHKKRSLLCLIAFFAAGTLLILTLAILHAAENAVILTRQSMRAAVSYEADDDGYWEYLLTIDDDEEFTREYQKYPRISADIASAVAEDSRVRAVNCISSSAVYSEGFRHVPVGNETGIGSLVDEGGSAVFWQEPDIMICGTQYPEMIETAEGIWTLVEGRFLEEADISEAKNNALITRELAEINGLHTGDQIHVNFAGGREIYDMESIGMDVSECGMTLNIVGIYESQKHSDPESDRYWTMSPCDAPENAVVMPLSTLTDERIEDHQMENEYWNRQGVPGEDDTETFREKASRPDSVVYLLNDSLETEGFVKDNQETLKEYTLLNTGTDRLSDMVRPFNMISFFAKIIFVIIFVSMIIISSLAGLLTMKHDEDDPDSRLPEKEYVLKKFAVLMILAVAGTGLSFVSGQALMGKAEETMKGYLKTEHIRREETSPGETSLAWITNENCFTQISSGEMLSNYHASITPKLTAEVLLAGCAAVFAALAVPLYMSERMTEESNP